MAVQEAAQDKPVYFKPRRLGHANLWVDDRPKSEAFYSQVCGLTLEFWEPDLEASFLGTGNTPHDIGMIKTTGGKARYGRDGLLQLPEGIGVERGLGHLAWELENEADLVDAFGRLQEAGIETDMTVDHQVAHSIYMFDPDANQIEFYCDTVKEWRTVIQGEMELITGFWTPGETKAFTEPRYDPDPEIRVVDTAPVHPRRITHTLLKTDDVDRLVDFYSTVGGMTPVYSAGDNSMVCLRGTHEAYRFHLAVSQVGAGEKIGYHHVSFELANEPAVDEAEKAVTAAGYAPEKSVDHPSKRGFFLIDPDGLRSEYFVRRDDAYVDMTQVPPEERAFLI